MTWAISASATKHYGQKRRMSVCRPLRLELLEPRAFLSHTPGLAFVFEPVAFLGDPTPGGDSFLSYFVPEGLNNAGEVAFAADVSPCERVDYCEASFRGTVGNLSQVLRSGQPAPGGGTLVYTLSARQAINDRGDIVENWFLDPLSSQIYNNVGVYLYSPGTGTVSPVIIPEVTPAHGGGVFHGAVAPDINNNGEIVFVATITTENGIQLADEPYAGIGNGVFKVSSHGQITSIMSPGDPAPGGGIFDFARVAAINDQGDVVFVGHVAGEPCGTWFPQSELIHCLYDNIYVYRAATGQTELIVQTGDASIGGRNYPGGPVMNNQGQVAFTAWDVQPAPMYVDNNAMYLYDGNSIVPVAVPGDAMPGGGHVVGVGTYINDHDFNNLGTVAFGATLDTDENADGSPDRGVYLWSEGSMRLVARTGTIIPGVGTVASIGPSGYELLWVRTNDQGQVFFSATLTDGRGVLLIATPAAAGDANRDFKFDQQDIEQVLQAAKYLTGQPATFEEGDWNGDGVFDQLDIVAALQTGNYLKGPYAAHLVDIVLGQG